jgi:glycerol-3-phosphate O-acyltransferase/dihydroxyacetone phosphate acyltransferase
MSDQFYRLGRAWLDQTVRLYYRRIEVVSSGRIPLSGPAILVANHPNSVADAFLLATHLTRRKVNFIAKDTITRAPVVGWLTRQFGLVGVARATEYRGRRELAQKRNQAAINSCVPRLAAGELLAIFGEGLSSDARHLHVIRKGAMRFGYAAEQAANFRLGLLWIPVGISYSSKHHFRSQAVINVGEPFRLGELHPDPTRHEPEVLQRGTDRLQRALESLVVHIEQDELVTMVDRVTGLFENPAAPLSHAVERQQRVTRALAYFNQTEPQRLRSLEHNLDLYHRQLAASGLSNDVVRQRHPLLAVRKNLVGVLGHGLLLVLNLYGWANSFIPRWAAEVTRQGARLWEKDQSRLATFGAYGGWAGATLAFPVQIWLVYIWGAGRWGTPTAWIIAALYALSLIPSWRLFVRRRDILRDRYANLRDAMLFMLHARPATRLQVQRRRLQREARVLLRDYERAGPRAA